MDLLSERYQLGDVAYGDAGVAVHRGYDQKLNRAVTIELPRAEPPNEVVAENLRTKARRMALADLPYVAALYDQGEQDGRPYLVFEELTGASLAEVAPLQPSDVVTLISALAATLRAAGQQQVDAPRLDPSSVRFGDGRLQIVDWGIAAATTSELEALSSLLALAATGSKSGTTTRHVPGPLLRVVQRAVDGEYASIDALEQDVLQSATAADDLTVQVPTARPTVIVHERVHEPSPVARPAPSTPRKLPMLPIALAVALVLLLAGGLWARNRGGTAETTAPAATVPAVEPTTPPEAPAATAPSNPGVPHIVATNNGRRLNVRAGPGQDAQVVGRVENGSVVLVVEGPVEAGGFSWVRIEGDGVSGWCILEALRPQ